MIFFFFAAKHGYDWVIPPRNTETGHMAEYVLMDGFKLTNLKELYLFDTYVTDEGIRELRKSLPDCHIEWYEELVRPPNPKTNLDQ